MEKGGTLENELNKYKENQDLPWELLIKISLDVIRALQYLHSQKPPILHNDLKPDNIMVIDFNFYAPVTVKLVDFGFSISSALRTADRDINSFKSMISGIIKYFANVDHPSATKKSEDGSNQLYLPELLLTIIENSELNTSKLLEFHLFSLYNKIFTIEENNLNFSPVDLIKHITKQKFSDEIIIRYIAKNKDQFIKPVQLQPMLQATPTSSLSDTTDVAYQSMSFSAFIAPNPNSQLSLCLLHSMVFNWIHQSNIQSLDQFLSFLDVNLLYDEEKLDTVFTYAAKTSNVLVLEYLLSKLSLDINYRNVSGYSAIHYICLYANSSILQLLLQRKSAKIHVPVEYQNKLLNPLELCLFSINLDDPAFNVPKVSQDQRQIKYEPCIYELLCGGAYLTENSTSLPDRLENLRPSLFSIFSLCVTGRLSVNRLRKIFCSLNNRELSRVRTMFNTVLKNKFPSQSPIAYPPTVSPGVRNELKNTNSITYKLDTQYSPPWLTVHIPKTIDGNEALNMAVTLIEPADEKNNIIIISAVATVGSSSNVTQYFILRYQSLGSTSEPSLRATARGTEQHDRSLPQLSETRPEIRATLNFRKGKN